MNKRIEDINKKLHLIKSMVQDRDQEINSKLHSIKSMARNRDREINSKSHSIKSKFRKRDQVNTRVETAKINSYESYIKYASHVGHEYGKRVQYEKGLTANSGPFTTEGYCYVCKEIVEFSVDYLGHNKENKLEVMPNWRECLVCPGCGLNNRIRAYIHLFEQLLRPDKECKIYISEQTTLLYKWLVRNYPNVVGSEYLGKAVPFGKKNKDGIRNENLSKLSFSDNQFDSVLSSEVFEHIPSFTEAFRECLRILKPNGKLFFTVPFRFEGEKNIVRAVMKENNKIEHLLEPEYHGNPLSSKGCLAFYYFGWEMLSQLKDIGFDDANAYLYWSKELGYLGGSQIVFVAVKGKGK